MRNAVITVIVPVYNVRAYLDDCITSIQRQTYQNLEIILVDDGSTDGCGEICDLYANNDSRITVIHKKNGGLSSARNTGLASATGEYISFVDSDDMIDKKFYEIMMQLIVRWNAEMAICSMRRFISSDEIKEVTLKKSLEESYLLYPEEAKKKLFGSDSMIYSVVWNKLYKRSSIEGMRFSEGRIYEDAFFVKELYSKPITIAFAELPLYFYRYVRDSILHKKITCKNYDICCLHEEFAKEFLDSKNMELYTLSRIHYHNCLEQIYLQSRIKKSEQEVTNFFYHKLRELYAELEEKSLLNATQRLESKLLVNLPRVYYMEKCLKLFVKRVIRGLKS